MIGEPQNSYKHKGSESPFMIGLCVLVKVVHYHYTHTCIGNKFPYTYILSPHISLHVQSPSTNFPTRTVPLTHITRTYMYIHNKHTYTQAHTEPPQKLVPASWLLVYTRLYMYIHTVVMYMPTSKHNHYGSFKG